MPNILQGLQSFKEHNKNFAGTIAFRNEKIALPDGSKVAIGIDSERWVILYQKNPSAPFVMFEYNAETHLLFVDKKQGTKEDIRLLSGILSFFFSSADIEDVMTIEVEGHKND